MNCIWLHACLALKKERKSNPALKPITCCAFDIIFYLSKNHLTRSPSWDEHISFSRVSWPTSRHQVNTLFQFQRSNRDKLTFRGLLNGPGLRVILQEFDLLLKVTSTVINSCISDTQTRVTHTSPADVLLDTFKMRQSRKQRDLIQCHMSCFILWPIPAQNNQMDYEYILSSIGVTFLCNLWILCSKSTHRGTHVCRLVKTLLMQRHLQFLLHAEIPFHFFIHVFTNRKKKKDLFLIVWLIKYDLCLFCQSFRERQ